MPLEEPRHSTQPECEVYHIHTECTEANNIETKYFAWGVGGKRLCKHCEKLADADAMAKDMIGKIRAAENLHSLFPNTSLMSNLYLSALKKPQ